MTSLTDTMLTTGQAARRLGVSADWIRKLVRQGVIPSTETPLGHLIAKDDIEAYAKEREAKNVAA